MLRTCNVLRIASLPVLRNDGGGRFADTRAGRCPAPSWRIAPGRGTELRPRTARRRWFGRGYWAWIASRGSQ
ncbi:MAG: hypothetical protein LBM98_00245 [Oscillospiraceae bacterium]|nr:hypothetical protein [Oscillospiraceae bacterium]